MTNTELLKLLSGPSRLNRKNAAKTLYARVSENPEKFKKQINKFIDALKRPEAQTRWLCLDILSKMVSVDANACKDAIEGAEEALFDEKTSLIRVSAIRFLCRYGASSMTRSKEVWPLIKEAIQQFHGELEFDEMLGFVIYFASGKLNADVKKDLGKVIRQNQDSVGGPTEQRFKKILSELRRQSRATSKKKGKK